MLASTFALAFYLSFTRGSISRPERSISVPQLAHVQPPQSAWCRDVGLRKRGTGVPQFGQPPRSFTSFCSFAAHIITIATVATIEPTITGNIALNSPRARSKPVLAG